MHKRYSPILESDSEDEEDTLEKKRVKYSKILDEEDDFWPEENFPGTD
jgi:hypothetical protein